jgi:hypothetical protein
MSFLKIQKLLDSRLKLSPSSPFIAWPNTDVKPGNASLTTYVRPTLLLANTELHTLNDYERIPGVYQIDIYGQLNKGIAQTYSLADEIKNHFYANRTLVQDDTIVLIQAVSLTSTNRDEAWWKAVLEVSFICYNN